MILFQVWESACRRRYSGHLDLVGLLLLLRLPLQEEGGGGEEEREPWRCREGREGIFRISEWGQRHLCKKICNKNCSPQKSWGVLKGGLVRELSKAIIAIFCFVCIIKEDRQKETITQFNNKNHFKMEWGWPQSAAPTSSCMFNQQRGGGGLGGGRGEGGVNY